MLQKIFLTVAFLFLFVFKSLASYVLVPMDDVQKDHLKSYGVAYWVLQQQLEVDWLLNYRGGSFAFKHLPQLENEMVVRGVSYQVISDAQYNTILSQINDPEANMDVMKLEKVPKIAVYSPKSKMPWDDAVTLVLTYAEIPYDVVYDDEVLNGVLPKYDWLHLHHEDFTGQYGKFYASYHNHPWYIEQQRDAEEMAKRNGFEKVSQLKLAVVKKIKAFVAGGGFMFAMCSATDTYDIALSADGVDIVDVMYDGDGQDPNAQQKLDYNQTFAFKNFKLVRNPLEYEFSNIDNQAHERGLTEQNDYFSLFTYSAKWDPIPTMLTQNHSKTIKGFMGQTTAFKKDLVKSDVTIMGETAAAREARYVHGTFARGTWTFYGGHDPEDYQHMVGEEPTDLALHPNSPGYRLILNNILFPAAKKKKQKT
ncbi:MAG: asparagine synthetase B [Hymenobacteraceae bacterium]|nr:asparagine synthetase B [Hymenobacteraceae bacterium]MDX5395792.1 asparagine synthetase B [Hymenobacteraceae bacterium]MDX5442220.1 asparagine synthetase B [Hymenobacteraceae bacterium]MDX5511847.1 asparagine synthetase B [Hymenobacteraceae bacterium]